VAATVQKRIMDFWPELFDRVKLEALWDTSFLGAVGNWLQNFFRSGYNNLRHTATFFAFSFMKALYAELVQLKDEYRKMETQLQNNEA